MSNVQTREFVVVPDSEREARSAIRPRSPLTLALIEGKTLFVPLNGRRLGSLRTTYAKAMKDAGRRLHTRSATRDGMAGLLMWADGVEQAR